MTPLGLLNFLVLQWFGVRLGRTYWTRLRDRGVVDARATSGGISVGSRVELGERVAVGWSLLRWVWPLTGWWSPYRWITRRG